MDASTPDSADANIPGLIRRLEACVELVGSVNKLARLACIPQSTIRPYFEGTDIPCGALLKIARAAGVSPAWLLTGSGPQTPSEDPARAEKIASSLSDWLTTAFRSPQEIELLATVTEISPDRLRAIFAGAKPEFDELVGIREVFMGYFRASGQLELPLSTEEALMYHASIAGKAVEGARNQELVAKLSLQQLLSVYTYLANVLRAVGPEQYACHLVHEDSMAPLLKEGDLVFVRPQTEFSMPGIYLLRHADDSTVFVSMVRRDNAVVAYFQNPMYRRESEFLFERQKHQLAGVAEWVLHKLPSGRPRTPRHEIRPTSLVDMPTVQLPGELGGRRSGQASLH